MKPSDIRKAHLAHLRRKKAHKGRPLGPTRPAPRVKRGADKPLKKPAAPLGLPTSTPNLYQRYLEVHAAEIALAQRLLDTPEGRGWTEALKSRHRGHLKSLG